MGLLLNLTDCVALPLIQQQHLKKTLLCESFLKEWPCLIVMSVRAHGLNTSRNGLSPSLALTLLQQVLRPVQFFQTVTLNQNTRQAQSTDC